MWSSPKRVPTYVAASLLLLGSISEAHAQDPKRPGSSRPDVVAPGVRRPPRTRDVVGVGGLRPPSANPWDFERGLAGWTIVSGDAFGTELAPRQPTLGDNVVSQRLTGLVSLGGDYWTGTYVPIGHQGDYWIGTYEHRPDEGAPLGRVQGDGPQGVLQSREFVVRNRFISFLIGGGKDVIRLKAELQVQEGNAWVMRRVATGNNSERMRREVWEVADLVGRRARIQIVDASSRGWGHINVDDFTFPAADPRPGLLSVRDGGFTFFRDPPTRVWGYADTHAHPMGHMGFGGLRGIRTLWGVPGGRYSDYQGTPHLIERDLPRCDGWGHGGGPASHFLMAKMQTQESAESHFLTSGHGREGGPEFTAFPDFRSGAHHQMHITQIRRAYEGGQRLMSALAVHNEALEYGMAPAEGPEGDRNKFIRTTPEREVIEAHVCGMRQLAELNSDWMEIAYSPEDARRIIGANKLAIVLGVEVDRLGDLGFTSVDAEVKHLFDLGIRQVTPIHGINNRLGGPSFFQDLYNTQNDLFNRERRHTWAHDFDPSRTVFFSVAEAGCGQGARRGQRGECVLWRFDAKQNSMIVDWHQVGAPGYHANLTEVDLASRYAFGRGGPQGQVNPQGLTPQGHEYIRALMSRGMLIDVAHMSDRSVEHVLRIGRDQVIRSGNAVCGNWSPSLLNAPEVCFTGAYPVMVSHADLRAQGIHQDGTLPGSTAGTTHKDFLPREFDLGSYHMEVIRRIGGVVGIFVTQDPLEPAPDQASAPFANDCGRSTKTFGYAYRYAVQKMGGTGVALATDFGFLQLMGPRFGEHACSGYLMAKDWGRERERFVSMYNRGSQRHAVRYAGLPDRFDMHTRAHERLQPSRIGARTFNLNTDGIAHYGMLPDVLQDAKNIGMTTEDFSSLFNSAESYIQMWEKAWSVTRCSPGDARCGGRFTPAPLNCGLVCRGTCPRDTRAGAPVAR
jgi:microsomal dipeptidase-like Zn-dependent dipeptidase